MPPFPPTKAFIVKLERKTGRMNIKRLAKRQAEETKHKQIVSVPTRILKECLWCQCLRKWPFTYPSHFFSALIFVSLIS